MDSGTDPRSMDELLIELHDAARDVCGKSEPHSVTYGAAMEAAAFAAARLRHHPGGVQERPEALLPLADILRDIIRADPDDARDAVKALRDLKSGISIAGDPRQWGPTEAQLRLAAQVLGVESIAPHHCLFTGDGRMFARPDLGNFQEIDLRAVDATGGRADV